MSEPNDPAVDGAGTAGHLVFVIDGALPVAVQQTCADTAAALATQTGMPVTVVTTPLDRLDALRDSLGRDADVRRREYTPAPRPDPAQTMSSAPFLWQDDGRPDWGQHVDHLLRAGALRRAAAAWPRQCATGPERRGGGFGQRHAGRDATWDLGDD